MTIRREDMYNQRNKKIYEAYRAVNEFGGPKYMRKEIGEMFGITGVRVGQIVRKMEQTLDKRK